MFNDVIYIFTDVEYMFNVGVFEIVCLARWVCIRRCHVSCPGLMTAGHGTWGYKNEAVVTACVHVMAASCVVAGACLASVFVTIGEVACVAQSRDDVGVLVERRVDGCAPDGGRRVGEDAADVVYGLACGDDRCYVDAAWRAFAKHGVVACLHRAACGEHWVGDDERLAVDAGRCEVFGHDVKVCVVRIAAVGGDESIPRLVEEIEESFVEHQSGPQDRAEHHIVVGGSHFGCAERCHDLFCRVFEPLANLVGHCFAYSDGVAPESHAVGLYVTVAQLGDEAVDE